MDAHVITWQSGTMRIHIDDVKQDLDEKLKSARIVDQSLEHLASWATKRDLWLGFDGGRYKIELQKNGSFTATLG